MSTPDKNLAGTVPLPGVQEANWRPDATAPPGISVENLRRRGIDRMRLLIAPPRRSSALSRLFGLTGTQSGPTQTITIADRKLLLDPGSEHVKDWPAKPVPFADVRSVEVGPKSGGSKSLRIRFGNSTVALGTGLPEDSLFWLRDRLLLELAGLVWKPVFNVGRRTTRATSSVGDDVYRQWPTGSPNRLIDAYLSEAPAKTAALTAAVAAQDWLAVKRIVHWLKSSCASVGAVQLSECCQRMEIEIDMRDIERITSLSQMFTAEFERVSATLERIRSALPVSDPEPKSSLDDAAVEATASHDPETAVDLVLAGIKVLLVEDSKVNQALASSYLEEAGSVVEVASDGLAAVQRFEIGYFDLIFMDCQMPGMDGFEATRIIRQKETSSMREMTPVIALTANALREDRGHCLAAGMNDYLAKPYTKEDIVEIARRWTKERDAKGEQDTTSHNVAGAKSAGGADEAPPLALSA